MDDGTAGDEVWRTDGTAAGTRLLFDHLGGQGHYGIAPFVGTIDGQFWFVDLVGPFGTPPNLWRTDGQASQPIRVIDGAAAGVAEFGVSGVAWGDRALCFARRSSSAPWELWRIDPQGRQHAIWFDSSSSSTLAQPMILDAFDGTALWMTGNGDLYVTDGSTSGTAPVGQGTPNYYGRALGGSRLHHPATLPGPIVGTQISLVRPSAATLSFTFPSPRGLAYGLGEELWVLISGATPARASAIALTRSSSAGAG
jgi:ELWxxDGT repeat protein